MPNLKEGLFLMVVGLAIVGGGGHLYQDAKQATENAVEVDATVVSSEVAHAEQQQENGPSTDVYYPVVEYRYTYEDETYTSRNLCPGDGSGCDAAQRKSDRSVAEGFVADHPEGETVTAYVQPDEPSNAHLVDASSATRYLILAGIGVPIVLAGLWELFFG